MRLLLVEDDINLQENLYRYLSAQGYSVDVANDGEEGLFQGREHNYDIAIIDIGLPKITGLELIKTLRSEAIKFPIILLTARNSWQDKVEGLEIGADDYLTKPFQNEELVARLNALIRRSVGEASPIIENGPLILNTNQQQFFLNQQPINLTNYEYKVLEYLILHIDEVKSKTVLTEHIYDQDFDLDSNVIEVFIKRLRKKLDPTDNNSFIETLRGRGYKLKRLSV